MVQHGSRAKRQMEETSYAKLMEAVRAEHSQVAEINDFDVSEENYNYIRYTQTDIYFKTRISRN
jgi:hypothetical protein